MELKPIDSNVKKGTGPCSVAFFLPMVYNARESDERGGDAMDQLKELPIPLLLWYRENARVLPWRSHPTPYRVWVSEIMLQQTRVAAVLGYYARFLEAFPSVEALAQAPEEQLMKLWEGLGYYSRARNLHKAARLVAQEGGFPQSYEGLLATGNWRVHRRSHRFGGLWTAGACGGRQRAAGGVPADGQPGGYRPAQDQTDHPGGAGDGDAPRGGADPDF